MRKRTLDKIALGIFILLLVGSLLINIKVSNSTITIPSNNDPLAWYRFDNLPQACKLPSYENDLEAWKVNLRHDQETWYCLKYFK